MDEILYSLEFSLDQYKKVSTHSGKWEIFPAKD